MQIFFSKTAAKKPLRCDFWGGRSVNVTREEVTGAGYLHDIRRGTFNGKLEDAIDDLMHYRIFHPNRMQARVCTPDGCLAVGATIVQRVFFGPIALETAVRVIELQHGPDGAKFAYATTEGHPERGIASFEVKQHGTVQFEANAWSRAGNMLAFIGRPVSRYLQKRITSEALVTFCSNSSRMIPHPP